MSRPEAPRSSGDDSEGGGREFARVDAVAGLARELEELRAAVAPLREVPGQVNELAELIAKVSEVVAAMSTRPSPVPAPSWLLIPDAFTARRLLDELTGWLHAVFLRYTDGAAALPECWLYHPDVVEELVWLMQAWLTAYQGAGASVGLAGDWHDRQRPGVVRRIRAVAGSCSIERHQTRDNWDQRPTGAVPVPGLDALDVIARWWGGTGRDQPAPEPPARPRNGAAVGAGPGAGWPR